MIELYKPFLKWVGGKTQIIEELMDIFPLEINNYHEPFLGGGSVLLAFLSLVSKKIIKLKGNIYASDLNENLINLYINIRDNPEDFIIEIDKITAKQIQKVAQEVFQPKNENLVVLGPYKNKEKFNMLNDFTRV